MRRLSRITEPPVAVCFSGPTLYALGADESLKSRDMPASFGRVPIESFPRRKTNHTATAMRARTIKTPKTDPTITPAGDVDPPSLRRVNERAGVIAGLRVRVGLGDFVEIGVGSGELVEV
jgi:hypothetical protein